MLQRVIWSIIVKLQNLRYLMESIKQPSSVVQIFAWHCKLHNTTSSHHCGTYQSTTISKANGSATVPSTIVRCMIVQTFLYHTFHTSYQQVVHHRVKGQFHKYLDLFAFPLHFRHIVNATHRWMQNPLYHHRSTSMDAAWILLVEVHPELLAPTHGSS